VIHPRDARILALATRLAGPAPSWARAIAALHEAVVRVIPAGKLYLIAPGVIGSRISMVGIDEQLRVVRVVGETLEVLARFRAPLRA